MDNSSIIDFEHKYREQDLLRLSKKIAQAVTLVQEAKALSDRAEALLIEIHLAVEDMYTNLEEQEKS